jgi:hypothetical protein
MSQATSDVAVAIIDKTGRVVASVDPSRLTRFTDVRDELAACFRLPRSKRVALLGPGRELVTTCRRLAALAPGRAQAVALVASGVLPDGSGARAQLWKPL